jgi:acyl-CoA synthetase (AMP-forming)/AMP-acid ligase II
MLKELELEHILRDSGAEIIIAADYLWSVVDSVRDKVRLKSVILTSLHDFLPEKPTLPLPASLLTPRQPQPDTLDLMELTLNAPLLTDFPTADLSSLALLQYTSGTTGLPKGAMISHANLLTNVAGAAAWRSVVAEDNHLSILPFFHVTGMVSSMALPLFSGGTMVLLSRFELPTLLQAISQYKTTCWSSIATMNIALVNSPEIANYNLDSLTRVKSGGAAVPLEILNRFKALTGVSIMEGYGLSETIAQVTINPPHRPKLGTVGIPVYDVEVKVVSLEDPEIELGVGQAGELVFKGPQIMLGYWQKPEATAEVLKDGWLRTGDIGVLDEEGYITIVGRAKELIKSSGYSVFPAEVEGYLYKHPAIREAAVIGVADSYRGETIKAYVVLKPEFEGTVTEAELLSWGQAHMAAYKAPRLIEIRKELPHTGSGKILRRKLSEEEHQRLTR